MVHAFVMVRAGTGEAETVRDRLLDVEGITAAHVVAGAYDVIAEVDGEEVYDLIHAASSDIGTLEGVTDTKTYISLN